MSESKMKRASIGSRKSAIVHEESEARRKYQILLQDFLEVQKDFVSKKRKLQVLRQRKETLGAEVRFLRQRLEYLQKLQNRKHDSISEDLPMVLETKQNLDGVEEEKFQNKALGINKMVGKIKTLGQARDINSVPS
ncbi:uncharacterized protein LOC111005070 [Momordica charantia]|uniref:Uncharacterized protein LOC111005070 n=1 Tax=Momordica charantia TaxID=3673 RepID=A0A6J1BRD5_MOMCH|nr:uncharacterized protein LOC111005070 [Momordica charantia]